ncbi:MAG TPA: hypothetical protein VF481_02200 [Novosphingobium sp.]
MILLVAALLAQATSEPVDQEITVMGARLQALSVMLGRDARGKLACNLSASSGNAGVDEQLCKTAARCFKQGAVENAAMHACIDARKPAILEDFAARVRARQS